MSDQPRGPGDPVGEPPRPATEDEAAGLALGPDTQAGDTQAGEAHAGDLPGQSARSGAVMIGSHGLQLIIGVLATAILARLLTPAAFGLVFMVTAVTEFAGSFRDFGFPMATVHERTVSGPQLKTLFWLNAKLNSLVTLFLFAMAPVVAWFFGEPELVGITLVLAVCLAFEGFSLVHGGLLRRELRFGTLTALELVSLIAGVVAAVGVALAGGGYWALVAQQGVQHLVHGIGLWTASGWRPGWGSGGADVSSLRRYGRDVTLTRVWSHVGRNLDRVVVGRLSGATALGLYQNAYRWSILPVKQVHQPLLGVAVATFSRVRDDVPLYRAYVRTGLRGMFALTFPLLAYAIIEAPRLVLLLLGPQWDDAVPLFRILVVAAVATSATSVLKWMWYAEGQTGRQLRWALISSPITMIGVLAGAPWGATGVAIGYTVGVVAATYPGVRYCLATSPIHPSDFWGVAWRPALNAAVAAVVTAGFVATVELHPRPVFAVPVSAAVYGLVYLAGWLVTPASRRELRALTRIVALLRGGTIQPAAEGGAAVHHKRTAKR